MKTLINIKTLVKTTLLSLLMVGCSWGAIKQRELGMMDAGSTTPAQAEEQWEDFIALLDNENNWYKITDFLDQNKDFVNSKHKWEKDTGYTALHYAAQEADLDVVEELIARGADVNAKTGKGVTPLHYAAAAGNLEVVECIFKALKEKKYGEEHLIPQNNKGVSPLHTAVRGGCEDIERYKSVINFFVKNTPNAIKTEFSDGNTVLHLAAYLGSLPIVDILLSASAMDQATLTKQNKGGKTPLDVARTEEVKQKLETRL